MRRTEIRPGAKSLERGSTFKPPRHPMRQRRRSSRPSEQLKADMAAFRQSVFGQRCAGCGRVPAWGGLHAHHVVYRQHLPVELAWAPENALALCSDCHERHHNASRRVPLGALTDENLEFAWRVLGAAAGDYLARYYGKDERC